MGREWTTSLTFDLWMVIDMFWKVYALIYGIAVAAFLLYVAFFVRMNPSHFYFYEQCDTLCSWEPDMPPVYVCEGSGTMQVCKWQNVPQGNRRIFLRHSNPFLFWIFSHQLLTFMLMLIPALPMLYKKREEIIAAFHRLKTVQM